MAEARAATTAWGPASRCCAAAATFLVLLARPLAAQDEAPCRGADGRPAPAVAHLVSVVGEVRINGSLPRGTLHAAPICAGDVVSVGPASRAAINLIGADTPLRLDENSLGRFARPSEPGSGLLDLIAGGLYFLSEVRRTLTVRTPYVNAGVEGTEVYLRVRGEGVAGRPPAELIVLEGRVALTPGTRSPARFAPEIATTGERVVIDAKGWPRSTPLPEVEGGYAALRRVAVGELSWTLYYPEILAGREKAAAGPRLAEAARLLAAGQADEAEAILAGIPDRGREGGLKAALLATIAVARKDGAAARRLAEAAVAQAPGTAAAHLALSYARQLALDLDGAFAAAKAAVAAAGDNPLAHARLAELHLMRGEARAARAAARRAVERGGGTLAEVVQGFAELAALRARPAEAAFRRALDKESQNPLALLGLGLARIKQGDLEAGRTQLENAVAHDPSSSLLRSYLGKAYFEERRDQPAAKQLAIAKALDPKDPTPWFYDAIRKQLGNRPVEALRDLERSIALNDNRAPFRSRLLLDQDAAARGVSLGRIYDDLGFRQLGVNEAAKSLALDPANSAAHRFLADLYIGEERREFARASQVLKAQLLAPPNANPLPTRLAETRLRLAGLETLLPFGFNEYGSMFERDRVQAMVTGIAGTQSTYGEEVLVSGLSGPVAVSASQLFTSTDGFRRNADAENRLQGVYGKVALNEAVSLQAEFRRRQSDEGDLFLNYDPELYFNEDQFRWDRNQDTAHLGATVKLSPSSTLLAAGFYSDLKEKQRLGDFKSEFAEEGYQGELQHIWAGRGIDVATGLAAYDFDVHAAPILDTENFDSRDQAFYSYVGARPSDTVDLTLGLAIDRYRRGENDLDKLLPKLGIIWSPTQAITVRAAALRTLKRPLIVEQTLEPTQVGGFTQLFDDFNGTVSELYGVGLDARLASGIYAGLEAFYRNLSLPVDELTDDLTLEDHGEQQLRGYYYWAINDLMSLTGEISHDRFRGGKTRTFFIPKQADTTSLSLGWRYRDPSGLYADLIGHMVHQEVERARERAIQGGPEGSDNFLVLNALVGYRLPGRRGAITLEANNILNQGFKYLDNSYRDARFTTNSPYSPERLILARVTLNF